ncbi:MAG: hypothetical protein ABI383_03315 [Acidobacteriaceae bacterium]
MGPFFSTLALLITILAAFMAGIAISKRLVILVLHLMMMGRLKHTKPVPTVSLHTAQSR